MFSTNLVTLRQMHNTYSRGQTTFAGILKKKEDELILKVKANDPHFKCQLKLYYDAWLDQIWWFQSKSVTSYYANNPNFLEVKVNGLT